MKIINNTKSNQVRFSELKTGDVFEYQNKYYLKTETYEYINTINLNTFFLEEFLDTTLVTPKDSKLILS